MTTRNPSRRFSPSLPSRTQIGIALASVAAGIAIGVAADTQPFQSWNGEQSGTNQRVSSAALAPSFMPAPPTALEAFQAEMALHEALTEAQFGPLNRASTSLAPGAGVTNDLIQPSAQERKLSPTGVNGFRDFDPNLVVPNVSSAAARDLTPFYESIADLNGEVASPAVRKVSPTGENGFRDFDPAVLYSNQ